MRHEDTKCYAQVEERYLTSARTSYAPAGEVKNATRLHKRIHHCSTDMLHMAAGCNVTRALGRCVTPCICPPGCSVAWICQSCIVLGFPYAKACRSECRSSSELGGYPSAVCATRQFHVSLARGAEMSVVVPSMGDSISEGSVASLEKKPGQCRLYIYMQE